MSVIQRCKVCKSPCDPMENPSLICQGTCKQKIHVRCLDRGIVPSGLIGDVFYDMFCLSCSPNNEEMLMRQKLPWLTTVLLATYNLREKSSGLSNRGYFHWKSDISKFIDNNWDQLFGKTVKKKKNWIGTISGTLSHYSGTFFKSGTAELEEAGWWKLLNNNPPEVNVDKYNKILEQRKQQFAKAKRGNASSPKLDLNVSNEEDNTSEADSMNQQEIVVVDDEVPETKNEELSSKRDNEPRNRVSMSVDIGEFFGLDLDMPNILNDFQFRTDDSFISECLQSISDTVENSSEDMDISEMSPSENFQENNKIVKKEVNTDDENETEVAEKGRTYDLPPPKPSLFDQSLSRPWPWDESIKLKQDDIRPLMSEREEEFLLQKIEKYKHLLSNAPASVNRLYRKLAVRKIKRQYGLPILNIDTFEKNLKRKIGSVQRKGNPVLDRFITEDVSIFFEQRLQGHCEPTSVHSTYTNRLLKPFIRRDTSSQPLWLKVTSELLAKVNGKDPEWKPMPRAPIDYSYIRPQHIPALNSLCTQFFWPGVDLTECLQYPEFTCVVLYKKLVVGFAIMVPDVGYNEAYISYFLVRPEWQKAGIGTFMLYHLIQTCMGKDITLHVSATNPALILYQKFGFKQEEFIQDFYDKYILPSSKESKHALFLRLSR